MNKAEWHSPIILAKRDVEASGSQVQGQPGKLRETLFQNFKKRWKCSSVVEHSPSIHQALISFPISEQ